MDASKHAFSADRAIEEIPQDRLGRSFFALKLADAVCNWRQNDSLVLAIYGEWGVGKTSLKNLFKCHCKAKGEPYIVEFNPWQWSAQEKIFEAFFRVVGERLGRGDISKQSKKLAKKWKYYAACWGVGTEFGKHGYQNASQIFLVLGGLAAWTTWVPNPTAKAIAASFSILSLIAAGLTSAVPGLFEKVTTYFEARAAYFEKDTDERRKELIEELRKLEKPLIVIVDDFDRLNREEIKVVIQLVKANSDLPNLVYLLLFQENIIAEALGDSSCQKGRNYLEKIIQVGFDIPAAQKTKLQKILLDELGAMLAGIDVGNTWNKDRWTNLFHDYLKDYFRTLRDVYRFVGMLKFHVDLHRNNDVLEVNPIDLILLHTLRVFEHPVFERIRDSAVTDSDRLLEVLFFSTPKDGEKHQVVVAEIVKDVEESKRKKVEGLLTALFPQPNTNFSNEETRWDRDLRICHQNHFAKYFEFAVREDTISALELSNLIRSSHDWKEVAAAIEQKIKQNRIMDLLDRLDPYIEKVPEHNIGAFLLGFLQASENLPPDKPDLFVGSPTRTAIHLLRNLLLRLPRNSRRQTITKSVEAADAFTLPALLLSRDDDKSNESQFQERLLTNDELKDLKTLAANKIKKAAVENRLQKSEHFLWLLNCWRHWKEDGEAANWAKSYVKDPETALTLVMAAVSVGTISGHRGTRTYDTLLLKWLEQFVNLEETWNHLGNLDQTKLDKRKQHVLELFQRGLEHKKRGEPYDKIQDQGEPFIDY